MHWPKLSAQISKIEAADPNTDTNLKTKFNVSCIVVLFLAFLEHMFSEIYTSSIAVDCEPDGPFYESSLKHRFTWLFSFMPYNNFIGFLMHNSPCSFWRTMREDYNRSVHLVRQVDNVIGGLVFTSFAKVESVQHLDVDHNLLQITDRKVSGPDTRGYGGAQWTPILQCKTRISTDSKLLIFQYVISGCIKQQTGLCGVPWERPMSSSGLQRADDDDEDDDDDVISCRYTPIAGTIVTYELVLVQFAGISPVKPEPIEMHIV
ncbi:unnamed protein product [Chrysodeixis includens]|uniref:Uncharacterized protein n=1 Tax=Chrysodeixis includens TaxID=689277 RepID=A0A9N8KPT6_CHRIL|nr:unnamed protein product [Chrysodeixis includens]